MSPRNEKDPQSPEGPGVFSLSDYELNSWAFCCENSASVSTPASRSSASFRSSSAVDEPLDGAWAT
jgi:hypothetical protein